MYTNVIYTKYTMQYKMKSVIEKSVTDFVEVKTTHVRITTHTICNNYNNNNTTTTANWL